jgi:hypothetical protein
MLHAFVSWEFPRNSAGFAGFQFVDEQKKRLTIFMVNVTIKFNYAIKLLLIAAKCVASEAGSRDGD